MGAYEVERGSVRLICSLRRDQENGNAYGGLMKDRAKAEIEDRQARSTEKLRAAVIQRPETRVKDSGKPLPKTKAAPIKNADRRIRVATSSVRKTASQTARAKFVRQEAARHAAKTLTVQKAALTVKAKAALTQRIVRAITLAFRALIMAIAAAGSAIILIVIMVILIVAILASAVGIFFSNDSGGMTCREAITQLTAEFANEMRRIESENAHDELIVTYTGGTSVINWRSVLAVYAARVTEDENGTLDVISFDETKIGKLKEVLFDMNKITYELATETRSATSVDEDGEEVTSTFTVNILKIIVIQKTPDQMAGEYGFTGSQRQSLTEITKPEYDALWDELLGSFISAGGMGDPCPDRIPTGMFVWPLPVAGTITSYHGWREHPVTGEFKFHDGTDIAADAGTPILAAASGTVTIANGFDSWAGGYGYYVRIDHGSGVETLYAHMESVAVRQGDAAMQGQIIGYVGSTGRSTGAHLHWEVLENGVGKDALTYFQ